MKTSFLKSMLMFIMVAMTLPIMGQDCMNIYFKDGKCRKIYLKDITEINTSKYDSEGIKHDAYEYQHVVTPYREFVYNIQEIDSISFSKYYKELAEHNINSALDFLLPILDECKTKLDVENKLQDIIGANGIEDAWFDGHELCVKISNWETISFHISHELDEEIESARRINSSINSLSSELNNLANKSTKKLKVVIANQQHYDQSRSHHITKRFKPLLEDFHACNFDTTYIDKPTINFFYANTEELKSMYDYDVVFLITHGSYVRYNESQMVHRFATAEEIGILPIGYSYEERENLHLDDKLQSVRERYPLATDEHIYLSGVNETRDGIDYKVFYAGVTEEFFKDIVDSQLKFPNNNSIFFNVACQSMMGDGNDAAMSMANHFTQDRGLGVYYGYTQSNYRGQWAGYEFFKSMIQGKSISKSYSDLHNLYKLESDKDEHAGLMRWPAGENGDLFLFPTNTVEIDQETANSQFKSVNYVEVEGWATSLDPTKINGGFEYDTNDSFSSCKKASNVEFLPLSQSSKLGNVRFRAKLTDLEYGMTYYYRAYTYDGLNYNYGDPCSFKIEKNADGPMPTDGLVAYYPFNGNANDESGNGNHGILSGNNVPSLTTDRHGNANSAYEFGGYYNPNWIRVPNSESLVIDKELTVSFWIQQNEFVGMDGWGNYSTTRPTFATVCKAGDGYSTYPGLRIVTWKGEDGKGLKIDADNTRNVWNQSISSTKSDYQLGDWLHVALVVNDTEKILYYDGVEVARNELNKNANFTYMNQQDLYIGILGSSYPHWYPFLGKIDDIRMYNKALNPSEIKTLYHEPNGE